VRIRDRSRAPFRVPLQIGVEIFRISALFDGVPEGQFPAFGVHPDQVFHARGGDPGKQAVGERLQEVLKIADAATVFNCRPHLHFKVLFLVFRNGEVFYPVPGRGGKPTVRIRFDVDLDFRNGGAGFYLVPQQQFGINGGRFRSGGLQPLDPDRRQINKKAFRVPGKIRFEIGWIRALLDTAPENQLLVFRFALFDGSQDRHRGAGIAAFRIGLQVLFIPRRRRFP